jgi:hypothetical protein
MQGKAAKIAKAANIFVISPFAPHPPESVSAEGLAPNG